MFQQLLYHYDDRLEDEPLQKRAWPYQERLLSTRTLIFSNQELKWECETTHKCECDLEDNVIPRSTPWHPYNIKQPMQNSRAEVLAYWYEKVVPTYSSGQLTKGSDKLPAISAIARRLQERIGGQYIAGIWETDALSGLFWFCHTFSSVLATCPKYRAPSFSWASIKNRAGYSTSTDWIFIGSVVEASCTPSGLEKNVYGHVSAGHIVIVAPTVLSWIRLPPDETHRYPLLSMELEKPEGSVDGRTCNPDTQLAASPLLVKDMIGEAAKGPINMVHRSDVEIWETLNDWYRCQCLYMAHGYGEDHYLVLGQSLRTPGAWERVAKFTLRSNHPWKNAAPTIMQKITIV
jgi:hypothetical protein